MDIDKKKCEEYLETKFDDVVWSPSRLSCYDNCPYEFYLKYLLGQRGTNWYAYIGTGVHNIIEDYYNVGHAKGLDTDIIVETMVKKFALVVSAWEEWRPHSWKAQCNKIVDGLMSFKPLDTVTDIERTILFDFEGYKFQAKLDAEEGDDWHIDYKSRWDKKKYGHQQTLYMYAKEIEQAAPPKGFKIIQYKERMSTVEIDYSKGDVELTKNWMRYTIGKIRRDLERGEFTKNPADKFYCTELCQAPLCEHSKR